MSGEVPLTITLPAFPFGGKTLGILLNPLFENKALGNKSEE
jgi:hypothetical protein